MSALSVAVALTALGAFVVVLGAAFAWSDRVRVDRAVRSLSDQVVAEAEEACRQAAGERS